LSSDGVTNGRIGVVKIFLIGCCTIGLVGWTLGGGGVGSRIVSTTSGGSVRWRCTSILALITAATKAICAPTISNIEWGEESRRATTRRLAA
jgi:hypothetical protein